MGKLSQFIAENSTALTKALRQKARPIYDPATDTPHPGIELLLRSPKNPQQHIISGMVRHLDRAKVGFFGMGMGTGKTYSAIATAHVRSAGRPYLCLVVCPPHLTGKWQREIEATVPDPAIIQARNWKEWIFLAQGLRKYKPVKPTFVITPLSTAKLGARWVPAASSHRRSGELSCPQCWTPITHIKLGEEIRADMAWLKKRKRFCRHCKSALWQNSGYHSVEPSRLIKKFLKNRFDYGVMDEQHTMKSGESLAGEAFSHFVSGCRKLLILTGTLISGRASDLRPTIYRAMPHRMVALGIGYHEDRKFAELYGRLQRQHISRGNRQRLWNHKTRTRITVAPGITPEFYRDFMADCSVFLDLEDMAAGDMPPLDEQMIDIGMSTDMQDCYSMYQNRIREIYTDLLPKSEQAAVKFGFQAAEFLMTWPDCPEGWGEFTYLDESNKKKIAFTTKDFPDMTAKEQRLLDLIEAERSQKRQVWVYVTRTKVSHRLINLLKGKNISSNRLPSAVKPVDREKWIQDHGPGVDVIISHPVLVETGIDLFGKGPGKYGQEYNFCTLVHY